MLNRSRKYAEQRIKPIKTKLNENRKYCSFCHKLNAWSNLFNDALLLTWRIEYFQKLSPFLQKNLKFFIIKTLNSFKLLWKQKPFKSKLAPLEWIAAKFWTYFSANQLWIVSLSIFLSIKRKKILLDFTETSLVLIFMKVRGFAASHSSGASFETKDKNSNLVKLIISQIKSNFNKLKNVSTFWSTHH